MGRAIKERGMMGMVRRHRIMVGSGGAIKLDFV